MKKIAIFWEKRFNNNNFGNLQIDINLNPYLELIQVNGEDNTYSVDLLENKKDKNEYIILCFLTLSIFTIKDYILLFIKFYKNKKYFFIYEPRVVNMLNYNKLFHLLFDKIYTRNDDLVDNKKYFKFNIPGTMIGLNSYYLSFQEKKLLTLINGNHNSSIENELYSERKKIIEYCEKNNIEFDLYGRRWNKPLNYLEKFMGFKNYKSYKGEVENKLEILSKYKFNICFENMKNIPGNITEKIWDSFKAQSIPIYWGASDINNHIPNNCYIDYRKFNGNYDKLIKYISEMSEFEYNKYIKNINIFLKSNNSQKWFDKQRANDFINNL